MISRTLPKIACIEGKPKRRWLRFSIRTLLIAVTIFCVWLGWQVSLVRARSAALGKLTNYGGIFFKRDDWARWDVVPDYSDLPVHRKWLGDYAVHIIGVDPDTPDRDEFTEKLKRLFPEADWSVAPIDVENGAASPQATADGAQSL